jgi:hypothetical protein
MISTQLQMPQNAYQLANQYELGELIRIYQVTPMKWRALVFMILGTLFFIALITLLQGSFAYITLYLFIYIILAAISVIVPLAFFMYSKQTENAAVYVCSAGFILRNRKQLKVVRWEEIAEVTPNLAYTSCVVQLVNQTSIKPNTKIKRFRFLIAELELKAQLNTHPELALKIEQQFEQIQNDPPWFRQVQTKANLYQEMAHYLKRKDPAEAYQLGKDYQLGAVLGTYHATFQSVFLPNADTWREHLVMVCLLSEGIGLIKGQIFSWNTFAWVLLVLGGIVTSRAQFRIVWNTRLHCYEKGLIYIQPGSFSVIKWKQVTKTICSQPAAIGALCVLQLDDDDTITISKHLNKRQNIRQILREGTPFTEVSPYQKKQSKKERVTAQ